MTPAQWQQVNRIFDQAADLPTEAQPAAVHELACGEAAVEAEVIRLLRSMQEADGFLAAPLIDLHHFMPEQDQVASLFRPGAAILNRFQIRRFLASGGMGEVYEAWDRELDVAVALKTIRPQIARHAEVIERFKQEVRNARGISHPNICRVYEIFYVAAPSGERTWFLSMELIEGMTLLDCIHKKGCLPPAQALLIARQLASGLEAAHQHGLVHRDFKSANVMLVEDEARPMRAVIMDFGLSARTLQEGAVDRHATAGTPGYMAPEQENGGNVGALADQYAFGVVLCEMLSGVLPAWRMAHAEVHAKGTAWGRLRAYSRVGALAQDAGNELTAGGRAATSPEDAAVVVKTEPAPLSAQAANAADVQAVVRQALADHGLPATRVKPRLRLPAHRFPQRAERVIRRCMERDPTCRFPDMRTAANTLVPPSVLGTPWRKTMAACLLLLVAAGAWRWNVWRHRCLICDVMQLTPDTDQSDDPSLSADGKLIAYSSDRASTGNLDIFVQKLPSGPPVRLTRDHARDTEPSLSPDGSLVAFRSERSPAGIYMMSTHGGQEHLFIPDGRNPRFSPDGNNLLYWTGDMNPAIATARAYLYSFKNGSSQRLVPLFLDARYPVWSPDGTKVLFTGCASQGRSPNGCSDWWVTSLNGGTVVQTHALEMLRLHGVLLYRLSTGTWNGDDVIFAGLSGTYRNLWSISLSPNDWQVHGKPKLLIRAGTTDLNPALARDTVAYTSVSGNLHIWRLKQSSIHSTQDPEKVTDDADIDTNPFVSENGRFIVFQRGRTRRSIFLRDTSSNSENPVLQAEFVVSSPIVDSTGRWVAYEQQDQDGTSIYSVASGAAPRLLCRDCNEPSGWFRGDRGLLFRKGSPSGVFLGDPRTGTSREVISSAGMSIGNASWSPTNQFLLFTVTGESRSRIAAVRLDAESVKPQGAWIEITGPSSDAHHPCWSADGKSIFYLSDRNGSQTIFRQEFSPEKRMITGKPMAITMLHEDRRSIDNVTRTSFRLSAGGDAILMNLGEATSTVQLGRRSSEKFFAYSSHN